MEKYLEKHIVSIMNKTFFVQTDETKTFQKDLENMNGTSLIMLDDLIKPGFGNNHNFDNMYGVGIVKGRINKETGNPEIYREEFPGHPEEILSKGDYRGFAFYVSTTGVERTLIVIGHYYEGTIPSEFIGTLLQLKLP